MLLSQQLSSTEHATPCPLHSASPQNHTQTVPTSHQPVTAATDLTGATHLHQPAAPARQPASPQSLSHHTLLLCDSSAPHAPSCAAAALVLGGGCIRHLEWLCLAGGSGGSHRRSLPLSSSSTILLALAAARQLGSLCCCLPGLACPELLPPGRLRLLGGCGGCCCWCRGVALLLARAKVLASHLRTQHSSSSRRTQAQ